MAKPKVTTVDQYIEGLPEDRRATIAAVRKVILKNLPKGYHEAMNFGMISYEVPLERLPNTYNKQPLCYAALASKKNYCTLHLMVTYGSAEILAWFQEEFRKAGKKLDMGKACVRFRTLDDLPLDVIGKTIAKVPVDEWVAIYEKSRRR